MTGLPQASGFASSVDSLFDALLVLSGGVALGICILIVWFCIRYRRGSIADRSGRVHQKLPMELAWTLLPLLLFIGIFIWSIDVWKQMRTVPANAGTIYVVAKQWMWKVQHPGGQREINTLHVPLGQPVRLVMISQDVIHSFYVPAFRVKQDVLPERYTQLWFTATRLGSFDLFCAEFCGAGHAVMGGRIVVMTPADYARWLAARPATNLVAAGAALFDRLGCGGCHAARGSTPAPPLDGLFGSDVRLTDGSHVRADDRYLHDAILQPARQVVAGFAPVMPAYDGRVDESDVVALIAYIKSLHAGDRNAQR